MSSDPLDELLGGGGGGRAGGGRRAFLVGGDPKSQEVWFGVKLALYRGKSINRYTLMTERREKWGKRDLTVEQMDQAIARYIRVGHEVDHPAIPEDNVPKWIAHFKKEAARLGLPVKNPP